MPSGTKAEKARKRRTVAKGVIAGKSTRAIAKAAQCSERHVQRLEREPETQFLITAALRPHQAKLTKLDEKVIKAVESALVAKKKTDIDHFTRLRAVERYGDLLELAQGKAQSAEDVDRALVTWEEFVVLYGSRKETS